MAEEIHGIKPELMKYLGNDLRLRLDPGWCGLEAMCLRLAQCLFRRESLPCRMYRWDAVAFSHLATICRGVCGPLHGTVAEAGEIDEDRPRLTQRWSRDDPAECRDRRRAEPVQEHPGPDR
jgi:hypothetical protein